MTTPHTWSPYQQRYFDWIREGSGSALLIAVAGAGKTTVLVEGSRHMTGSVASAMYNKSAATEFQARLQVAEIGGNQHRAGTFHSFGYAACRQVYKKARLDERAKTDRLLDEVKVPREYGALCTKMVSLAKQAAVGLLQPEADDATWWGIVRHHDLDSDLEDPAAMKWCIGWAREMLVASRNMCHELIDFDDMIYMPVVNKSMRVWQNDWLLVDECFLPDTPVLTGKRGEWKTIGEIVETGYTGSVLTWCPRRGVVLGRVTGHKKIRRNKRMVQIRCVQRHKGWGQLTRKVRLGTPIVVCTEDHLVKTAAGWTKAGELQPGETVYLETTQGRIGAYQTKHMIGARGKQTLSQLHLDNKKGQGNKSGTRKNFISIMGGNGRGPTSSELLLQKKLAEAGLETEIGRTVPLGGRSQGYPTHYKLDLCVPGRMIGIEVDGASHRGRRDQDAKKDKKLTAMGWSVIRLTNEQVAQMTPSQLLQEITPGCLVEAEILSVEEYTTQEQYVYDIEVDGTNCYFAHGLLVHNCQDTNPARRCLARKMLKPGGRAVFVGDPCQAIYGFTGADNDSLDVIRREFGCTELPLTISYRCPRAVVREAKRLVSHIEVDLAAPEGKVRSCQLSDLLPGERSGALDVHVPPVERLTADDAVLCRVTKPLVKLAFRLIRAGIACHVEGREIGTGLLKLATRWKSVKTMDKLRERLQDYLETETAKMMVKKQESQAAALADRVETLLALMEGCPNLACVEKKIADLFKDGEPTLTLSTVHKAKGREWGRVYILGRGVHMPSKWARQDWQQDQERNLEYVAVTRAKSELIDVVMPAEKAQ
jgi:very-short-patch-repair endonuclease